jgi:histidine ammonia-lyase
MDISKFEINGHNLTIDLLYQLSVPKKVPQLTLASSARTAMLKSQSYVLKLADSKEPIYGINTGFGALSNMRIQPKDLATLQRNLVRSHCTGVGAPYSPEITRAIIIVRANCLAQGFSGISPTVIDLLLTFLNQNILPIIPEKGSVGASGDLAPLAHIALSLIGEGEVWYQGAIHPTEKILSQLGIKPVVLGPKEGLALINGTAVMTALGSLALYDLQKLAKVSDVLAALSVEGLRGSMKAFDHLISQVRPHSGQMKVANNMRKLLAGSAIMESHKNCGNVQDAYSLRCIPQVHGACRETFTHGINLFNCEINSVTDNPLIFPDDNKIISGGNFHGEPLALSMDYACMGASELCSISERRVEKFMNPAFSQLPAFLTQDSGLNSGFMIAHVTHAALVSENKVLCHPASVDSIPTSTDKEDHVSMGVTSGNKLLRVIDNLKYCLSIELLCNTQALDFLSPLQSTPALNAVHELVRKVVPPIHEDRNFSIDIKNLRLLIDSDQILDTINSHLGGLE